MIKNSVCWDFYGIRRFLYLNPVQSYASFNVQNCQIWQSGAVGLIPSNPLNLNGHYLKLFSTFNIQGVNSITFWYLYNYIDKNERLSFNFLLKNLNVLMLSCKKAPKISFKYNDSNFRISIISKYSNYFLLTASIALIDRLL